MPIQIKRIYEKPGAGDGMRVLVDRLWPRGLSKEEARIDYWDRTISPSNELRRWYGHDPDKWAEFRTRYFQELEANPKAMEDLRIRISGRKVTFLFSSKEERLNNAVALKDFLERIQPSLSKGDE